MTKFSHCTPAGSICFLMSEHVLDQAQKECIHVMIRTRAPRKLGRCSCSPLLRQVWLHPTAAVWGAGSISAAVQPAVHDVFDGSVVRSWLNSPLSHTLETDIYAATNIAKGFVSIGQLGPERGIPSYILGSAAGFALLSVAKVLAHALPGCMPRVPAHGPLHWRGKSRWCSIYSILDSCWCLQHASARGQP